MTGAATPQPDERALRDIAGSLLHAYLAGRTLPEHLGDIPDEQIVDRLARMDAKEMLATLQELYDVAWWDRERFERVFVDGALAAWRPGTRIVRGKDELRIVSATCPLADEVRKDGRHCDACQALQRHAAYLALVGQVQDVRAERLLSRGETACETRIVYRPGRRAP